MTRLTTDNIKINHRVKRLQKNPIYFGSKEDTFVNYFLMVASIKYNREDS